MVRFDNSIVPCQQLSSTIVDGENDENDCTSDDEEQLSRVHPNNQFVTKDNTYSDDAHTIHSNTQHFFRTKDSIISNSKTLVEDTVVDIRTISTKLHVEQTAVETRADNLARYNQRWNVVGPDKSMIMLTTPTQTNPSPVNQILGLVPAERNNVDKFSISGSVSPVVECSNEASANSIHHSIIGHWVVDAVRPKPRDTTRCIAVAHVCRNDSHICDDDDSHDHNKNNNNNNSSIVSTGGISVDSPNVTTEDINTSPPTRRAGGVTIPFPVKLHKILDQGENDSVTASIITWLPHGRAFRVENTEQFMEKILKYHFRQSKLTSFQRQLNLYGFRRLTKGTDAGGYYHKHFLRGKLHLASQIMRQKIKGARSTGNKQLDDVSPETDFQDMTQPKYVHEIPRKVGQSNMPALLLVVNKEIHAMKKLGFSMLQSSSFQS
jgi:hypothetical protein